jgi:uncharacterized Zn-binding protein involved in type VI secretion
MVQTELFSLQLPDRRPISATADLQANPTHSTSHLSQHNRPLAYVVVAGTGPAMTISRKNPGKNPIGRRRLGRRSLRVMGQPAARVADMHVCPMVTGIVPHVGGPILPPGGITTLIGGMPAARVGDMCVCVGPPDVIALGSFTVLIGGQPAARMGDLTAHGGTIVLGMPTVLIG